MRSENKKRGFTLIELIVVIAIIVILIALIAPNAAKLISTASQTKADANAKSGYTAAMACITETYAAKGAYPSKAEVTSGLVEYLSADAAGKGAYTVAYTEKTGALASCTYTDGNVTGIYPKNGGETDENKFVTGVNGSQNVKDVITQYYKTLSKDKTKSIDSKAPDKFTSGEDTWAKKLKDALKLELDGGSWRITATKDKSGNVTENALYWTDSDISDLKSGSSITVTKYVWDSATNTYKKDSTGTATVGVKDNGTTNNKTDDYNIIDSSKYKESTSA